MVVAQHNHVPIPAVACPEVDVVKLYEVVGLRIMNGRTKWAWYLLPSNSWETIYGSTHKGSDVVRQYRPVEFSLKGLLSSNTTTMTWRTGVGYDA